MMSLFSILIFVQDPYFIQLTLHSRDSIVGK